MWTCPESGEQETTGRPVGVDPRAVRSRFRCGCIEWEAPGGTVFERSGNCVALVAGREQRRKFGMFVAGGRRPPREGVLHNGRQRS